MRQSEIDVPQANDLPTIGALKLQTQSLYNDCYETLVRTHSLWKAAQQIKSSAESEVLLTSRNSLLDEVGRSVGNLENAIDFLQSNRLRSANSDAISQARVELQHGMDVAQRIQTRLDALDDEFNLNAI